MNDRGKSDGLVVPAKPPNNAGRPAAEVVEGRGPAEGNAASETRPGRSAGQGVSSELDRVRQVARRGQGGAVHRASASRRRRPFAGGLSGDQPAGRDRGGRRDVARTTGRIWRRTSGICTLGSIGGATGRGRPGGRTSPSRTGGSRPLGVAALEDKILQRAVVEVLNAIYEPDFLGFSYGFRPGTLSA